MRIDERKVQFIKDHVKNYMKINAYTDRGAIHQLKRDLVEAGFYSSYNSMICDTHIINLIQIAQGKKPFRNIASKKELR